MGYRCADCKAPLLPGWDCGKCGSFEAEEDDREPEPKPVAWAVFAPNGNIRMWSSDSEPVRKLAEREGLPLTPLYAHPPGG
jgi:hypothetical protein